MTALSADYVQPTGHEPCALSWSGGKDSALAFWTAPVHPSRARPRQRAHRAARKSREEHWGFAIWDAGLAASLSLLDRRGEACSILDDAARDGFEHVGSDLTTLATFAAYADAAARTRHAKVAEALYAHMEPLSEQTIWMVIMGYGHARLWLGLLAGLMEDHARADEHLSFACQFNETNEMPLWAARRHLGWAEGLAARGDAAAARAHAMRALELSREHAYGAFEKPAAALVETESAAGT